MSGDGLKQRLAAILAADVAGYSRLMAADGRVTVVDLDAARSVFKLHIESNQGRVIDMAGDSVLAVFETATGAVSAALEVQRDLGASSSAVPEVRRMRFRIGVHMGDVIEKADGTVYGDGVNIAARLEGLADPGGISVSESIRSAVKGKVGATFEDQGEQKVKNIIDPVRVYRVSVDRSAETRRSPGIAEIDLSLPGKPSIAVLPFANMSSGPEQEYFTDGITEDIITELSRFHSLFVIARNSTFTYKGKAVDVRAVAKDLGVRYVVEGSIRRTGKRVRVTAQLIDALQGSHLWAERYDRVLEDIFEVQEDVTKAIVSAIAPKIATAEIAKARLPRPGNLTAYEIAVRATANARDSFATGDTKLRQQAIDEAKHALSIDPESMSALNTLAGCCIRQIFLRTAANIESAWQEGMAAVNRAIEIDSSDHRAYQSKGTLLLAATVDVRFDEALLNLRRGHELNPNDAQALRTLGYGEAVSGNPQQGIEYVTECLRLSPLDPKLFEIYATLGIACFVARDYENAVRWSSFSIREAPSFAPAFMIAAVSHVGRGALSEAKRALETLRRLAPEFLEARLNGYSPYRREQDRQRSLAFTRIAAGLEDPSAADALR